MSVLDIRLSANGFSDATIIHHKSSV